MATDVNAVGLFRCKTESTSTDTIEILHSDKLEDYEPVRDVTRRLIGKLEGRDFIGSKSARIHSFTEEADQPRDVSATSTRDLLANILDGQDLNENFETLASWYLQTDYAQSGLLIITQYLHSGHSKLAIIKAPFVEAYEPDDDELLSELDQVIQTDLRKGILYPRVTPTGEQKKDQACVYQASSSSNFPKHWYKYLSLEKSQTPSEALSEEFDKEEDHVLSSAESTDDFDEINEQLSQEARENNIEVQIGGGKEVRIKLKEILARENVHLVEDDSGFYLVISGEEPDLKWYDSQDNQWREVLKGISEYESVEDVFN